VSESEHSARPGGVMDDDSIPKKMKYQKTKTMKPEKVKDKDKAKDKDKKEKLSAQNSKNLMAQQSTKKSLNSKASRYKTRMYSKKSSTGKKKVLR
jgi:hypothetical protein